MSDYEPRHQSREEATGNATLVAGVVVFLASLAGLVYMEVNEHNTTQLMVLTGPVIAALLVNGHISRLTGQQNTKLETVISQTNGALDNRIREGTLAALKDAGITAAAKVTNDADHTAQQVPTEPPSTSTMPSGFHRQDSL